ncbi:MAG: alkaline phosphatase family protein, partial [Polyangiales bacterium]
SVLGATAPNRSFLYAATSGGGKDGPLGVTKFIFTELETAGIDWRIYGGATYGGSLPVPPVARARNLEQLTADFASGDLGQVAFISAEFEASEHPPYDIHAGEEYVHDLVLALMKSPAWSSTALFITYDETGGFFEHVPPPPACPPDATAANAPFDRLGFRVPFVLVSAYARRGYVSHRVHSHASITRFIEASFDLPALTDRDANSDALVDLFDFASPPSPPPDAATVPAAVPQSCTPPE